MWKWCYAILELYRNLLSIGSLRANMHLSLLSVEKVVSVTIHYMMSIQWNLSFKTSVIKDHPVMLDHLSCAEHLVVIYYDFHLPFKTTYDSPKCGLKVQVPLYKAFIKLGDPVYDLFVKLNSS